MRESMVFFSSSSSFLWMENMSAETVNTVVDSRHAMGTLEFSSPAI
jgi:hypothetical protein